MDRGEKVLFSSGLFSSNMDYKVTSSEKQRFLVLYTQIGISYVFNAPYGSWSTLHVYYFIPQ